MVCAKVSVSPNTVRQNRATPRFTTKAFINQKSNIAVIEVFDESYLLAMPSLDTFFTGHGFGRGSACEVQDKVGDKVASGEWEVARGEGRGGPE